MRQILAKGEYAQTSTSKSVMNKKTSAAKDGMVIGKAAECDKYSTVGC